MRGARGETVSTVVIVATAGTEALRRYEMESGGGGVVGVAKDGAVVGGIACVLLVRLILLRRASRHGEKENEERQHREHFCSKA
jgi:hypothetical protein